MPTVLLGCGCFWSKEYYLSRLPGVKATHVGFAGGHVLAPTYQEVCTKQTGHAEVVRVTYNPAELPLKELLKYFFSLHDATIDRRGRGGQYRSSIFFPENKEAERSLAWQMLAHLKAKGIDVVTEIATEVVFYPAAGRHQQYCDVRGIQPRDPKGTLADSWSDFEENLGDY